MKEFLAVAVSTVVGAMSVAIVMLGRKINKAEDRANRAEAESSSSKSKLESFKGAKEASDKVKKRDIDEENRSDFDNDW